MSNHAQEVREGQRFEFGKNWAAFLALVDENRIRRAEESLAANLECRSLSGMTFLDAGSGSGLFSLAARRLGARVHSFDYDPQSVACTSELKRRYFKDDPEWTVESGSVLDRDYLERLGRFDVVYSWGVLHHTGMMWKAIENTADRVAENGKFFISIYNDQGRPSRIWRAIKRTYNRTPRPLRFLILIPCFIQLHWRTTLRDLILLKPFHSFRNYREIRGMSVMYDLIDWVGGYPFEVAKPEEIFDFCRARSFVLQRLKTCHSIGCNEFVFRKSGNVSALSPTT